MKWGQQDNQNIPFPDRESAAVLLAEKIRGSIKSGTIVLAVPRGGVITGKVLAKTLGLQLDLILCKKIGHPGNPEYAIGSVCADGSAVQTDQSQASYRDYFEKESLRLSGLLTDRYKKLSGRPVPIKLKGKRVLICDDGAATGSTLLATVKSVKQQGAINVSVAVPVLSESALNSLIKIADHVFYISQPSPFGAVGDFYVRFPTVEDEYARYLLQP